VARKRKSSTPRSHEKPFYLPLPDYPPVPMASNKEGEKAAARKRKSTPFVQGTPVSPSLRKKVKLVSAVQKKFSTDDNDDDYHEDDDSTTEVEDDDERKPAAVPKVRRPAEAPIPHKMAVPTVGGPEVAESPPLELRTQLIEAEERVHRAERQVRAISRTRLSDTFIEGQVRTWAKETLWKQCKFITNDQTMNKVMRKAVKHFKVPDVEQVHWMSTFAHIVRDGLNQKRNACSQDLRRTIKSKVL
jgi:hypothetical protein